MLAVALGCGRSPSEDERAHVISAIERLRSAPTTNLEARRRFTQELRDVQARGQAEREARDGCASAYDLSTEMFERLGALEAQMKSGAPVEDPKRLAEELRRVETMRDEAEARTRVCGEKSAALLGPESR